MQLLTRALVATGIVFVFAAAASAAEPDLACQSGKLKVTGKYAACRLSAEAKGIKTASTPDYAKCESKFSDKWVKAETKAGLGICPSEGDEIDIDARTTDFADTIAILLAGGVPVGCGNNVADGTEQCDGADLGGQSCQGLGYTLGGTLACTAGCGFDTSGCVTELVPASGQTISYGAGDDGDVQAGAALAYVDNGDGTISDSNTGLMWEKKILGTFGFNDCSATEAGPCANPHNADNGYSWSAVSPNYDGGVVSVFLEQLNNRCDQDTTVSCTVDADCAIPGGACGFAGHRDWRLPNGKELHGVIDWSTFSPALDAAFHGVSCGPGCTDLADPACSCDASSLYWSATTLAGGPSTAWLVFTGGGDVFNVLKTNASFVRAVRGGS